jgi:MFS superfamily sulfate permease-like transporter
VSPRLRRRDGAMPPLRLPRGLLRAEAMREETRQAARKARREAPVLLLLFVGVLYFYDRRRDIAPDFETAIQVITVVALVILGWRLARDLAGRSAPSSSGAWIPRRRAPSGSSSA